MVDKIEKITKLINKIENSEFIGFYNDKTVNLRIDDDVFILFNSYYFKDKLKSVGFVFDSEICAWIGDFDALCDLEDVVLERLLQAMGKRSINKIKEYIKNKTKNNECFSYNLS